MIILGDIAVPNEEMVRNLGETFRINGEIFKDQKVVLNLEGLISDNQTTNTKTPVLFNHSALLDLLNKQSLGPVVLLANNHTLDLPKQFEASVSFFQKEGIPFAGAGKTAGEAVRPGLFNEEGRDIYLFNYCWDFLLYHQNNPSAGVHVAEIEELKILEQIVECREKQPDASILVCFHWSLDLEKLPYPMYRRFSRALIDAGANVIAGCHSHCVQGGEKYKDGYIVYGLGNFYIPWNEYVDGKLKFPEFSKTTVALEWDPKKNRAVCHWFEYREDDKSLILKNSELFEDSSMLAEYSPYKGMTDKEYESYFKQYRRKSFLIPVFRDHQNVLMNKFLTFLLKTRARIARKLAEINLIKWQS